MMAMTRRLWRPKSIPDNLDNAGMIDRLCRRRRSFDKRAYRPIAVDVNNLAEGVPNNPLPRAIEL